MAKNEVFELPSQENVQTDLRELCRGAIRVVLELTLEEELKSIVGAKRFERAAARHDHRNGTYMRPRKGANALVASCEKRRTFLYRTSLTRIGQRRDSTQLP